MVGYRSAEKVSCVSAATFFFKVVVRNTKPEKKGSPLPGEFA
jgi:hypothetical protein